MGEEMAGSDRDTAVAGRPLEGSPQVSYQASHQAEHPDPTSPGPPIRSTGAGYYGATPPWPAAMIKPSASELARWTELWSHPQAASWIQRQREQAVASLVRLEERCSRRRPSARAYEELVKLRRELGLDETAPRSSPTGQGR